MKILSLESENVKNIRAIAITPKGGRVVLTGKNGAGKSSVIDSIYMGLTGEKIKDPIRHGETTATIKIDMGELVVKRVFTKKGARLEVWNGEGAKFASPQALLDKIFGTLLDPFSFQRMERKKQRDLMVSLAGLDLKKGEDLRAEAYVQRTFKNRTLRDLEGELAGMDPPEEGLPGEELSISEAFKELSAINDKSRAFHDAEGEIEGMREKKGFMLRELERLKRLSEDIAGDMSRAAKDVARQNERIAGFEMPEEIHNDYIVTAENKLEAVEQTNIKIRAAADYRKGFGAVQVAKEAADFLTGKIQGIDIIKADAIKNAKYPVVGLSVSDDSVLFKGVPFDQISTGQQIELSTMISMALNPKLKIILIRDGSLLDKAAFKSITKAVGDKGYQLWVEKLDESGKVGFYIEDGSITAIDGEKVEEKTEEKTNEPEIDQT